ncbi:MAG: alanine:cation symporter family protein, partial [Synergistaceae bacterium]|nr:alanine:cation symporter family protein [Synergistaceae bacterium]
TLTALAIMTSGVLTGQPDLTGAQLSLSAFETVLGGTGTMILSVGLGLFAFSTILGWYWYSETCGTYIFGTWIIPVLKVVWVAVIVLGAAGGVFLGDKANFLSNLWDMSDTLNGLMAAPNLVALLLLSGELRKLVKDFDEKRKNGTLKI